MKKTKSDVQITKSVTTKSVLLLSCVEKSADLEIKMKVPRIAIPVHAKPVNFDWPAMPLKTPTRTDHKMIFFRDFSCTAISSL